VGCHLAGDGDYGMPTSLPWGMVYSQGTYPPSAAFRNFPDIVQKYGVNGVVPDTIPVHPAPLYELIMSVLVFSILWKMRKKLVVDGKLFMLYLILAGAERFGIEFIRLNPRILLGLTEAQIIAAVLILAGLIGLRILPKKSTAPAIPG
jgi:phosphatidylglycerol:prolipoprotein diacylglycerol transferase